MTDHLDVTTRFWAQLAISEPRRRALLDRLRRRAQKDNREALAEAARRHARDHDKEQRR